jgi:hypothetical protein
MKIDQVADRKTHTAQEHIRVTHIAGQWPLLIASEKTPNCSESPDQILPQSNRGEQYPRRWGFDGDVDAEANPLKREVNAVRHDERFLEPIEGLSVLCGHG